MVHLKDDQLRKSITVDIHRHNLTRYALPFFHNLCEVKTLQEYQTYSRKLGPWLLDEMKLKGVKARYVQMSLRVFWRWLIEEGLVEGGELTLKRIVKPSRPTPLKKTLTPEAVLGWQAHRADLRLIALLGYFFSLRPQETFALQREDFVAGDTAAGLECCQVMKEAQLFNRFALRVNKQRGRDGTSAPKQHSFGQVACFDERAARLIISILNELPSEGSLFKLHFNSYLKLWNKHGIPGVAMKDLRRSSLYWLVSAP